MNTARLGSTWAARRAAGLVALSLLLATGVAPAGDNPVFLGAVGVGNAKPQVEAELRLLLRAELASADFSRARLRLKGTERYALSATLVRLDSIQSAESTRATCVVSVAILRDGSLLHAMVHGRATAEEARAPEARSDALRAAVHSAMVRVPKALRVH
ncbi:MAG TPA: hypothetical protein VJV79_26720 [Polyangiaceae bacterium]|nr:hypothetical protein [Polyangiaceae bacterium]